MFGEFFLDKASLFFFDKAKNLLMRCTANQEAQDVPRGKLTQENTRVLLKNKE